LFSHLFLLFSLITITHSPTSTLFPYTTLFRSHMETEHVTGTSDGGVGDPSPVTSLGIYYGMKAAAKEKFGSESLKDKKIAVQGVGQVAYHLCKHLHEEGAQLIVTDINEAAVQRAVDDFQAKSVKPDDIYS